MRTHGLDITSSESADSAPFFQRPPHHRHIPSEQAPRVPRQGFDPVCVLFWCVLVPFTIGWFWYTIYGLIHALVKGL